MAQAAEQLPDPGEALAGPGLQGLDRPVPLRQPGPAVRHDRVARPGGLLHRVRDRLRLVLHDREKEDLVARVEEELLQDLPALVRRLRAGVADRDHGDLHALRGVGLVLVDGAHRATDTRGGFKNRSHDGAQGCGFSRPAWYNPPNAKIAPTTQKRNPP